MTGRAPFIAFAAALSLSLTTQASAETQTIALPDGLAIALPEGWRIDGPADGKLGSDGRRRIQLVCETAACKSTQETCTIVLRRDPVPGADDAARMASLYASPSTRYFRIRAVLKNTSKDAQILKPLEVVTFGSREWHAIETDARHNYKSGLFAETVIDSRYVGVICKTCETGSERHQAGRAIIASFSSPGELQARAETAAESWRRQSMQR